jgi:hypothetical protein
MSSVYNGFALDGVGLTPRASRIPDQPNWMGR